MFDYRNKKFRILLNRPFDSNYEYQMININPLNNFNIYDLRDFSLEQIKDMFGEEFARNYYFEIVIGNRKQIRSYEKQFKMSLFVDIETKYIKDIEKDILEINIIPNIYSQIKNINRLMGRFFIDGQLKYLKNDHVNRYIEDKLVYFLNQIEGSIYACI